MASFLVRTLCAEGYLNYSVVFLFVLKHLLEWARNAIYLLTYFPFVSGYFQDIFRHLHKPLKFNHLQHTIFVDISPIIFYLPIQKEKPMITNVYITRNNWLAALPEGCKVVEVNESVLEFCRERAQRLCRSH